METCCGECLSLLERLSRASDQYLAVQLAEDWMIRDGWRERWSFGVILGALRVAETVRRSVTQMLVNHREEHEHTHKTRTAGQ